LELFLFSRHYMQ